MRALLTVLMLLGGALAATPSKVETLHIKTNTLGRTMTVRVYLPPDYDKQKKYPPRTCCTLTVETPVSGLATCRPAR